MDIAAYAAEAEFEADHWWFTGRRLLFADIIRACGLPPDAKVLDVGTGTGANLRMLRGLGFADVIGVDRSREAIRFCAEKGLGHVKLGDIRALPFPDASFDLVLATDVIEHVEDDLSALRELCRVVKPGRPLLVTVPAFNLLWGLQDEVSHHWRRYRLAELLDKMTKAALSPQRYFYFNYLLFLPILAARQAMHMLRVRVASEGDVNTRWLNRILERLFRFDVRTAQWLHPPIGVSALALAVRN
jgi:SAM-dependent methyltransferase